MADGAFIPQTTPTGALLDELALVGYRPFSDEADPRPLPEASACHQGLGDVFDALGHALGDTRLEDDLDDVLWGIVNVFQRKVGRLDQDLDRNEIQQRESIALQNGSEVRSVELEQLTAQGISLVERRNAFEALRDIAADLYAVHTGSTWRPAVGSKVNRATLTASMLDSRDFMNARQRVDNQVHAPKGAMVGFISSTDFNDTDKIWAILDKTYAKHPDMVLAHTGEKIGGPKIASCWAVSRKVTQVVFSPDFTRHQKSAPFKRNDKMLEAMPIGVIAGPGQGVRDNLVDKARRLGIAVVEIG